MNIEIINTFKDVDICRSKVTFSDIRKHQIFEYETFYTKIRHDAFMKVLAKKLTKRQFKKVVYIRVETFKKIGSKAIL